MKLKEYIKKLQELEKEHGDLDLVYTKDDEGNGYQKVYFEPTAGHYSEEDAEYMNIGSEDYEDEEINSICVN